MFFGIESSPLRLETSEHSMDAFVGQGVGWFHSPLLGERTGKQVKREIPSLMKKEDVFRSLPHEQYIATITGERSDDRMPKIPVATTTAPHQQCGKARRIGGTRTYGRTLPIYRKVSVQGRRTQVMLPSLLYW